MPLKAIVDGKTITGPDLSPLEWADLKTRHRKGLPVVMGCCGAPGHLRMSPRGTRHFCHAAGSGCPHEQESKEHLEIKYRIYRICRSEGWEATVEFPAPDRDWISDVCARRDGRKVVFEIQISTISPGTLEDRDRKYRNQGIESYWLLGRFFTRSRDFASWYDALPGREGDRSEETVPYIDPALFLTGPENHVFIAKGIRSAWLDAAHQTLCTTGNPAIPLAVWVREVLRGNYRNYLEDTAARFRHKVQLKTRAAPALFRFRDFYRKIIRNRTYREQAGSLHRRFGTDPVLTNDMALQKRFRDLYAEIDWLESEYRSYAAEHSGLFAFRKIPGYAAPRPYFRLESGSTVKKLEECVNTFTVWEASFDAALASLARELSFRSRQQEG